MRQAANATMNNKSHKDANRETGKVAETLCVTSKIPKQKGIDCRRETSRNKSDNNEHEPIGNHLVTSIGVYSGSRFFSAFSSGPTFFRLYVTLYSTTCFFPAFRSRKYLTCC